MVTLEGLAGDYTQGHPITFKVKVDVPLTESIQVPMTISDATVGTSGIFVSSDPVEVVMDNRVTIGSGVTKVPVTITTTNPGSGNEFGNISLGTSTDSTKYTTNNGIAFFGELLDNTAADGFTPRLSIQAYSTTPVNVSSNPMLTFTVLSSDVPNPPSGFDAKVQVSETGSANFLTTAEVKDVPITGLSQTFDVAIADPTTNEDGTSTITVELIHDSGYSLVDTTATPNNHKTSATVTDVVAIPEVSIATEYTGVIPGQVFSFTVTSSLPATQNLPITITARDTTNSNLSSINCDDSDK